MREDDTDRSPLSQDVTLGSRHAGGVGADPPIELELLGQPPVHERADARRNRQKVLAAAERLFAERGVDAVSMDDVVAAAGVGKGTLYRRFGDKSGLAVALLDDRERELQQGILSGPPPLGPGAAPGPRLAAFIEAYLDYVVRHVDVVAMSQTASPGARLRGGAHHFWIRHVSTLLREAGSADPVVRASVLLGGLSAEQVAHWLRVERRSVAELCGALTALVADLA